MARVVLHTTGGCAAWGSVTHPGLPRALDQTGAPIHSRRHLHCFQKHPLPSDPHLRHSKKTQQGSAARAGTIAAAMAGLNSGCELRGRARDSSKGGGLANSENLIQSTPHLPGHVIHHRTFRSPALSSECKSLTSWARCTQTKQTDRWKPTAERRLKTKH